MFKKFAALAALTVVVALAPGVASNPAAASTAGAIHLNTQGGFVAPRACQFGPPRFQVTLDEWAIPDLFDWSADITITGPGGFYDTDFLWDDEGWNKVFMCNSPNRAGVYTVTADVEITHDDSSSSYETVTSTFRVTGPVSSTVRYAKKRYGKHGWILPVRVSRAGRPWAGRTVQLQGRMCGVWGKVHAKRTNSRGRVTFTSRPKKGANSVRMCGVRLSRVPFRFYVAGNYNTKASKSGTFRLWRR